MKLICLKSKRFQMPRIHHQRMQTIYATGLFKLLKQNKINVMPFLKDFKIPHKQTKTISKTLYLKTPPFNIA